MSGQVIRIQELATFEFGALGVNGSTACPVGLHVDVSQATSAELMVRLHATDFGAGTNGTIDVIAFADGHTTEDPGVNFLGATALATVSIGVNDGVGAFKVASLTAAGMGSMITVIVAGTQDSATVKNLSANLSIDLALKW